MNLYSCGHWNLATQRTKLLQHSNFQLVCYWCCCCLLVILCGRKAVHKRNWRKAGIFLFLGATPRFLTQFLSSTNLSHLITILASILVFLTCFQADFFKTSFTTTKIFFCNLHRHFCHKTQCTERKRSWIFTRLFVGGPVVCAKEN